LKPKRQPADSLGLEAYMTACQVLGAGALKKLTNIERGPYKYVDNTETKKSRP
jgi:hypothetical protein